MAKLNTPNAWCGSALAWLGMSASGLYAIVPVPGATVEVIGHLPESETMVQANLEAIHAKMAMGGGHSKAGGGPAKVKQPPEPKRCQHTQGRSHLHSGYIAPDWTCPRDGQQLFFNTFLNATKAAQQFTQEVSGEIKTELNADLQLSYICIKAGVAETVVVRRVFNVNIPAQTKMSMSAHANMMDKDVGMLVTCAKCREVLSAYNAQLTAARGINEYFKTIQ